MEPSSTGVFYRDLTRQLPEIVAGEGVFLIDASGRRYLDAVGGAGVAAIGHGVKEITDAVAAQGGSAPYTYGATFTNPWLESLARKLLSVAPSNMEAVYLVSGGSEANETAVKMARQYFVHRGKSQKYKILSRWQSFHGVTLAMLALSGRPSWRRSYEPYLHSSPQIVPPYCYRCPFGSTQELCSALCVDDVERAILREGPKSVAAVIVEPICGTSITGAVPGPDYHRKLREICDRHDVLFIADEVLSGYGRTGKPFAVDHWDVKPDIITCGKAVGSGYAPLAAAIASDRILDAFRSSNGLFTHGFTYSGHPLSCLIGCQVFEYVQKHDLFSRAASSGEYLFEKLTKLADRHPIIGDVRGKGLLAGLEFVKSRKTKEPFPQSDNLTQRIVAAALERGLLIIGGIPGVNYGRGGDHIQLTPPYSISREEIDQVVDTLDDLFTAFRRDFVTQ